MLRRLLVGNFSFEDQLAGVRALSAPILRLEAELAAVWTAIARDGDEILCPEPFDEPYWERIRKLTNVQITPIGPASPESTSAEELVPWGHTPRTRVLADRLGLATVAPHLDVVRQVNSREFAWHLEASLGIGLLKSELIRSSTSLKEHLASRFTAGDRWVLKTNLSQSGREQLRGAGSSLTTEQERWLERRFREQGVLVLEPFLNSVAEIGVQWHLSSYGSPRLLGVTRLLTDARGAYRGTAFSFEAALAGLVRETVAVQTSAVARIHETGYFGPLGIDAMIHRRDDGELAVRAVQDVNARWTMGRIAWEWNRRLDESGSAAGAFLLGASSPAADSISLSPERVGGIPCRLRTWWSRTAEIEAIAGKIAISE